MALQESIGEYFKVLPQPVTVTVTPPLPASPYTVEGILEVSYFEAAVGLVGIESRLPTFTAATADFTNLAEGDTITYGANVWTVQDPRPDGSGVTRSKLEIKTGTTPDTINGFSPDLDFLADTNGLATKVAIDPAGAPAAYNVNGIFTDPYQEAPAGMVGIQSRRPSFTCRSADLTTAPAENDKLTVNSTDYDIKDPRPDGKGITRMYLHQRQEATEALTGDDDETLTGDEGQDLFGDD